MQVQFSSVAQSCPTLCDPVDCSPPRSSVMGFSRQEYWSGLPCSLGISNFLEVISSLSHSIVFLYFCVLITQKGFLISPGYSLELCIQILVFFLFSFAFHYSSFSAICKASPDSHFAFLHCFFLGMVLIPVCCTMS